ncbi:DUF4349 domain-containing protein [Flavobacterium sp. PL02]|jgi:cbb3-type cytochrome oxidase subunit 3|uniref:DUF4349 domain-containing protein n=1 Tax=Flavobacterium sp. PL02 TaxID=3088354 RepID=UPI002B22BBFB|nr:DUF4349 domain-containing protein [Flavobacterium sp. PL02]MEA9414694.1 DUF4349 domain-containing protein [Flavobacterium sp. PL02]
MKSFFLSLIVLLIASSCNSNRNETSSDEVVALSAPPPPPPSTGSDTNYKDKKEVSEDKNTEPETIKPVVKEKKIIKDGTVSVKTNDIAASKKNIDELLKKLNGYYETEDLQNNDQSISYDLKIRVPADNFEKLISNIENGKDELTSKSIQARDVTEEFVDITTRLANKREYLKRYKELLSKASTVKDILAIEENIRVIEEEIESTEGRLKYLSDQVSFSTLNLNLYKEKEYIYKAREQDKFSERIKNSISEGWTSIVDFLLWLFSIWPFIILITGIIYIFRKIRRKRKNQAQ